MPSKMLISTIKKKSEKRYQHVNILQNSVCNQNEFEDKSKKEKKKKFC